jgi:hypothetical protein
MNSIRDTWNAKRTEIAAFAAESAADPITHTQTVTTSPLTFWKVTFAVVVGNVLTGVVFGLIYEALK